MIAKHTKSSGNIFADLGATPDEAKNLLLRAQLMIEVELYVEREGLTQVVAAKRLGITQSRLSELKNGRIDLFTIDKLVTMLERAGVEVSLKVKQHKAA